MTPQKNILFGPINLWISRAVVNYMSYLLQKNKLQRHLVDLLRKNMDANE